MSMEEKVVQTRMEESLYLRFRRAAKDESISLKEALREAAEEFVERHGRHDPDDPLFAGADEEAEGETLTARETEDYLYGSNE